MLTCERSWLDLDFLLGRFIAIFCCLSFFAFFTTLLSFGVFLFVWIFFSLLVELDCGCSLEVRSVGVDEGVVGVGEVGHLAEDELAA